MRARGLAWALVVATVAAVVWVVLMSRGSRDSGSAPEWVDGRDEVVAPPRPPAARSDLPERRFREGLRRRGGGSAADRELGTDSTEVAERSTAAPVDDDDLLDGVHFKDLGKEIWSVYLDQHEEGICELVLVDDGPAFRGTVCACALLEVDQKWYAKHNCHSLFGDHVLDVLDAREAFDAWVIGGFEP